MTQNSVAGLNEAPLGKKSPYINTYTPSLLFPVPRKLKRDELQIPEKLPFRGYDIWNAFEVSWLNPKGKPVVALAEFEIPCESPCIIESKSFKLYLNSFNNSQFQSFSIVEGVLKKDLSQCAGLPIRVRLIPLNEKNQSHEIESWDGTCLDDLDISCHSYDPDPTLLKTKSETLVHETVYSDLLKSNCLVTGQPDWASVRISYKGMQISHEGLLQYLVSLRDHNEFHEQCVERIFTDIARMCRPERLSVYARYTRRGGLDINPYRTNDESPVRVSNKRLVRQ